MNTQERLNRQARVQEWVLEKPHNTNPVLLVALVALGSLAVGVIPLAYTSAFGNTKSQAPTMITGEAGLWSVLGEKSDTYNNSAPRQ